MNQLLYMVVFGEMALILLLLFKTPLRKLEIMAIDRVKRGSGPLIVKSIASTVFVIMLYTVYTISDFQARPVELLNPVDRVLLSHHLLQASLMGFALFLSFMIDKLHHYIRELRSLRKIMEAAKTQSRGFDDGKSGSGEEIKSLEEEVHKLRNKMKKLESECEAKRKQVKSAQANSTSQKNQSEELLLEYDRLLEQNQNLRSQLQSIDHNFSHSDGKRK